MTLSISIKCHYTECHYSESRAFYCYAECHYYAECRYAECCFAECCFAMCRTPHLHLGYYSPNVKSQHLNDNIGEIKII